MRYFIFGRRGWKSLETSLIRSRKTLSVKHLTTIELKRCEGLHDKVVVSASRLDEVESAYRVAVARVKETDEAKRLLEAEPKPEAVTWHEAQVAKAEADMAYYRTMLEKTRILAPVSAIGASMSSPYDRYSYSTTVILSYPPASLARFTNCVAS